VTVLDVIQRSTEFLGQKHVESPRLQIELLLAHVLKMPRLQLYLNFQRELAAAELDQVREFVRRRGLREPLQYIVGTTSFCGLEIKSTPAALIPRPETELLAERAWQFLAASGSDHPDVLDAGTGTGCIAIAMAAHAPAARVTAVDLSPEALALARENAAAQNMADRIRFELGDAFAIAPAHGPFDLVVSNPPYIATAEIEELAPEVRQFEPRLALEAGADGLVVFRRFAAEARPWLKPGGRLMLEFGAGQENELRNLFESQKWVVDEIIADYTSRPRILIARAE